jgi:hypothetical protein
VEQQLPASQGERQVAKFVEDDEVFPAKIVGQAPPPMRSRTKVSLIGVPSKRKSSTSLASGNWRW